MMVFADGFEDTEAIGTIDVLKRGNIEVDLAWKDGQVTSWKL